MMYHLLIICLSWIIVQGRHERVCLHDPTSNTSCSCPNETQKVDANGTIFEMMIANERMESMELYICSEINLTAVMRFINKKRIFISSIQPRNRIWCQDHTDAGFLFINVSEIILEGLTINKCAVARDFEEQNTTISFKGSIVIMGASKSVTVSNLRVSESLGIGLALINNQGMINITESIFVNNSCENGCGGVYIDYSKKSVGISVQYFIHKCQFINNFAGVQDAKSFPRTGNTDLNRGGGLKAFYRGESNDMILKITDCMFLNNNGTWGAAAYINIQGNPTQTEIHVNDTTFMSNKAKKGGSLAIAHYGNLTKNNRVLIYNCTLANNTAKYGGGVYMEITRRYSCHKDMSQTATQYLFLSCEWIDNGALKGAAIDIRQHYLPYDISHYMYHKPEITFMNCTFEGNMVKNEITKYPLLRRGRGIVNAYEAYILFQGDNTFQDNNSTALYLFSSKVQFRDDTRMEFLRNEGYQGGAIALYGSSTIHVWDNVTIVFDSNRASDKGGAIFQETAFIREYISMKSCFLDYHGKMNSTQRRVSIYFMNNTAQCEGQSIYVSSYYACKKRKDVEFLLSNLTYDKFSTNGHTFNMSEKHTTLSIIPGKVTRINIQVLNDLNMSVSAVYKVTISPNDRNSNVLIDPDYVYVSDNKIRLLGIPNSTAELQIVLLGMLDTIVAIKIRLQECPPGFAFQKKKKVCICSAFSDTVYAGIQRCDAENFQANLTRGYWAGYIESHSENGMMQSTFHTANCPKGFCSNSMSSNEEMQLPMIRNNIAIYKTVCNTNSTGILCSRCIENNSVFYHTNDFLCRYDQHCNIGWLIYILSELTPVTILFTLVIGLDIKFTTGAVNGFIFYAQIFDSLLISANNIIWFESPIYRLLQGLRLILRTFNLNFFTINKMSFCLWPGANTLDVIAFNYVTITYSLVLVLLAIIVTNKCSSKINKKSLVDMNRLSNSIIHGLSSFLVLCYSQCTKVSLLLLTPTKINGETKMRVFYLGELQYFHGKHLQYAIPAMIFLIVVTILPPLLLFSYPLCYKVLAVLKLGESKFTKLLCKVIPLEKYKPLFDSFQGTFKDKHRYFAGLYFVYRLSLQAIFVETRDLTSFYVLIQIQLVLMLTLHAWVRPYKNKWHNRLDAAIFSLMAVLNSFALYNYLLINYHLDRKGIVRITSSVQVILSFLPLVYILSYVIVKITIKIRRRLKNRYSTSTNETELVDDASLSMLEYRDRELTLSSSYNMQRN